MNASQGALGPRRDPTGVGGNAEGRGIMMPWLTRDDVRLCLGDSIDVMRQLPAQSVRLICTSPPYWALRDYGPDGQIGQEERPEQFLDALWAWADACHRVLADDGVMVVNLGDKMAGSGGHNNVDLQSKEERSLPPARGRLHRNRDVQPYRTAPRSYNRNLGGVPKKSLMMLPHRWMLGLIAPDAYRLDGADAPSQWLLRQEVIWHKPNPMPESVPDRPHRNHETIFVLSKNGNHVGADLDPSIAKSVWTIPTVPLSIPDEAMKRFQLGGAHYAAFPPALPRSVIDAWSEPGDVVLDPFLGTGTTVMMARVMGRVGWGIDLNEEYLRLATWRIFESGDWTTSLEERALIRAAAGRGVEVLTLFKETA